MNINEYYKLLNIADTATDEEIASSYKKLAQKYHPDKNPNKKEWANEAMTRLNLAYRTIMNHRFNDDNIKKNSKSENDDQDEDDTEIFVNSFVKLRETAKDSLYRFFQYSLYNLARRETVINKGIFNEIVIILRKIFHSIKKLSKETDDQELLEHFSVFNTMIFNFYKASECLTIIDSYSNQKDVEAYRLYKSGDDILHLASKEIFYDRHNRGSFESSKAYANILEAEKIFDITLRKFPESSWAIETSIKLEYTRSLKRYMELFFTED